MSQNAAPSEAVTPPGTLATSGLAPADLRHCEQEPIHIPGTVQPHGVLLCVHPETFAVTHASVNCEALLRASAKRLIGRPLVELLDAETIKRLREVATSAEPHQPARYVTTFRPRGGSVDYHLLLHHNGFALVLEFEEAQPQETRAFDALYPLVQSLVADMAATGGVQEACELAAREVRAMTGFDRVLVYQFDSEWNGTVIAEDGNDRLPSYRDLRFPASDIPPQARELYRLNPIRLIPDASYKPVPIEPSRQANGEPFDLSFAALRSVSPVHVEYMKNMGTAASMSVSVLEQDKLWGLISCHHSVPRQVPFHVRTACTFVGQVLSQQIVAQGFAAESIERLDLKTIQGRLLARMAETPDFVDGLTSDPDDLLALGRASGAAVVAADGRCILVGRTPTEAQCRQLLDWLTTQSHNEIWSTDRLSELYPPAAAYPEVASGVLSVSFSKLHARHVIWFRPEVVRTVNWAGDPNKPVDIHTGRIHPRHSFEVWKQTVRNRALPFRQSELDAAAELRNNMVGIVLRKAEELAELTGELERSNKELEAFSYSVSHDLRAPFRHIVGYSELLREQEPVKNSPTSRRYVDTIIESARFAGTLVDNLLTFSQMGRATLSRVLIDMNQLFSEGFRHLRTEVEQRNIKLTVSPLPKVRGDLMMMRLVVQNLLDNAIKYTRSRDQAEIEVGCRDEGAEHVFFVRDNGVGFNAKYVGKLFGVFQRLHKMEEFEGTGIGLANVRRIVTRHGGRTWAEGEVDKGATFYFSLPKLDAAADAAAIKSNRM